MFAGREFYSGICVVKSMITAVLVSCWCQGVSFSKMLTVWALVSQKSFSQVLSKLAN